MLYVGSDSNLEVLGLKTEDAVYVVDATITCTITDPSNVTVATVTLTYRGTGVAVTVNGVTYPEGNYRGVLSGSNSPALVAGTVYKLHFAASNYNVPIDHYEIAQARIG